MFNENHNIKPNIRPADIVWQEESINPRKLKTHSIKGFELGTERDI